MPKTMMRPLVGLGCGMNRHLLRVELADNSSGIAGDNGKRRNVPRYDRARPDNRAFAYGYSRQHASVESDPDVAFDLNGVSGHVCASQPLRPSGDEFQFLATLGQSEGHAISVHQNN